MTLEVDVECTERCFDLPEWKELLDRDPDRHIFAMPEWNRLWWDEFGAGKDLFFLTTKRGGDVVGILPLYRKTEGSRRILRFIGGIDLTDYLGPVCSLDDRDDVAEALVWWLRDTTSDWDEFDGHNMPVPFGFAEFLVERADAFGFEFELKQEETSAVLELPNDWSSYEALLSSKDRHELRRKRRRLAREHPDAAIRTADDDTLDADLKTFIEMHRGAEGLKGHFMRPEIATFFDRIARAFMPLGSLRLDLLEVAHTAIASTLSFEFNGVLFVYNSAFEPEFGRLSPGVVLVSHLVERSIDAGLRRVDLLRGPERYKYELGAQPLPLNNVRICERREG